MINKYFKIKHSFHIANVNNMNIGWRTHNTLALNEQMLMMNLIDESTKTKMMFGLNYKITSQI